MKLTPPGISLLVAAALLSSACTGGVSGSAGGSVTAQASVPAGVSVELLQYRRDEADGVVEVKVRNGSSEPLRVARVELSAAGFPDAGPVTSDAVLAPGEAVDVRVRYGELDCGSRVGDDVIVRLGTARGALTELRPAVGLAVLQRIHDHECAVRAALAAVSLQWSTVWEPSGSGRTRVVDGALEVGPVAPGKQVEVVALDGTTLLAATTTALPVTVGAGRTVRVPVRFAPQRCDPHAVGESNRGYAFGVRVVVAGAGASASQDAVAVTVVPDEEGRDVLEAALLERCGLD